MTAVLTTPDALPAALARIQAVANQWRIDYEDRRHNGEPSPDQHAAEAEAIEAGATEQQIAMAWDRGIHWGAIDYAEGITA